MLREARPIAAYCGADHAARLLASLAPGRLCQVEWFSSWNEFMAAAWGSCCVLVWIDRLDVSPEHAEYGASDFPGHLTGVGWWGREDRRSGDGELNVVG